MKIGLCTISNKEESIESICETAAASGVDGIELWGGHIDSGVSPREMASTAADRSLSVLSYGSYLRAGTETFDDELEAELDTAVDCGADLIRVWAGESGYADHDPERFEQSVTDLTRLVRAAGERGIEVTVERHKNSHTDKQAGAQRLIEAVDSPHLGLNWQPLFGQSPEEVVLDAEQLAPLSNNVHLLAIPDPADGTKCALSKAYFDLPAVIDAFETCGFDGALEIEFVTSEVPYRDAVANDIEYLRSIVPKSHNH